MALFSYPVCTWLCQYVNMGVRKWLEKSAEKQKYKMRKTANPLSRKAFRAVSFSATKDTSEQSSLCSDVLFCVQQKKNAIRPLLCSSFPNRTRAGFDSVFLSESPKCFNSTPAKPEPASVRGFDGAPVPTARRPEYAAPRQAPRLFTQPAARAWSHSCLPGCSVKCKALRVRAGALGRQG